VARPKEFAEDDVLDRALQLFWERGYEGTSVEALVQQTGVQRASLYATFGSKHDLFVATLRRYFERQFLLNSNDGLAAIAGLLERVACDAAGQCRGCYVVNSGMEMAETDPAVAQMMAAAVAGMESAIAEALKVGQARGEVAQRPLLPMARMVVSAVLGLRVLARAKAGSEVAAGVVAGTLDALKNSGTFVLEPHQ